MTDYKRALFPMILIFLFGFGYSALKGKQSFASAGTAEILEDDPDIIFTPDGTGNYNVEIRNSSPTNIKTINLPDSTKKYSMFTSDGKTGYINLDFYCEHLKMKNIRYNIGTKVPSIIVLQNSYPIKRCNVTFSKLVLDPSSLQMIETLTYSKGCTVSQGDLPDAILAKIVPSEPNLYFYYEATDYPNLFYSNADYCLYFTDNNLPNEKFIHVELSQKQQGVVLSTEKVTFNTDTDYTTVFNKFKIRSFSPTFEILGNNMPFVIESSTDLEIKCKDFEDIKLLSVRARTIKIDGPWTSTATVSVENLDGSVSIENGFCVLKVEKYKYTFDDALSFTLTCNKDSFSVIECLHDEIPVVCARGLVIRLRPDFDGMPNDKMIQKLTSKSWLVITMPQSSIHFPDIFPINIISEKWIHGFNSREPCFEIRKRSRGIYVGWISKLVDTPLCFSTDDDSGFSKISEDKMKQVLSTKSEQNAMILRFGKTFNFEPEIDISNLCLNFLSLECPEPGTVVYFKGSFGAIRLILENMTLSSKSQLSLGFVNAFQLTHVKFGDNVLLVQSARVYGDFDSVAEFNNTPNNYFITEMGITELTLRGGSMSALFDNGKVITTPRESSSKGSTLALVHDRKVTIKIELDDKELPIDFNFFDLCPIKAYAPVWLHFMGKGLEEAKRKGMLFGDLHFSAVPLGDVKITAEDTALVPDFYRMGKIVNVPFTITNASGVVMAGVGDFDGDRPWRINFADGIKPILDFESFKSHGVAPPEYFRVKSKDISIDMLDGCGFVFDPIGTFEASHMTQNIKFRFDDPNVRPNITINYSKDEFPSLVVFGNAHPNNLTFVLKDDEEDANAYGNFFLNPVKIVSGLTAESCPKWAEAARFSSSIPLFDSNSDRLAIGAWCTNFYDTWILYAGSKSLIPSPNPTPLPELPKDKPNKSLVTWAVIAVVLPVISAAVVLAVLKFLGCFRKKSDDEALLHVESQSGITDVVSNDFHFIENSTL